MQDIKTNEMSQSRQPLISFIIPCHDALSNLLSDCLDSILSLRLKPELTEIIVVDDGSTIDYSDIISQKEANIVFYRQQCKGVSSARNTGIGLSHAEYVQFVDADDRLIPAQYDKITDLLVASECDVLSFQFTTSFDKYKKQSANPLLTSGREMMLRHNINSAVWSYVFRRKLLDEELFDESIAYSEDDDFVCRNLIKAERVIMTDITAYYYRQHDDSVLSVAEKTNPQKRLDDIERVLSKLVMLRKSFFEKDFAVDSMTVKALDRRISQMTMNYIYLIIYDTRAREELSSRLQRLKTLRLFPLPFECYTAKYYLFALLSRTRLGLWFLQKIIPLMNKEQ